MKILVCGASDVYLDLPWVFSYIRVCIYIYIYGTYVHYKVHLSYCLYKQSSAWGHPVILVMRSSAASDSAGENLLHSFDINESEMSTAQYSTYHSPGGYGDVLDSAHGTYTVTLNGLKKVLKDKHSAGRRFQGSPQPEKALQGRGSPNYEESGPTSINCKG
jgi:hypothetical protein